MTIPRGDIRNALRKLWLYSSARKNCHRKSRVVRNQYRCAMCMQIVRKVQIDHIEPVGATPGARGAPEDATWDRLIDRMFNGELQALCEKCHGKKTLAGRKTA